MDLKVFNSLPSDTKDKIHNIKEFKQLRIFCIIIPFIHWKNSLTITKCNTLLIIYYMLFMPVRKFFSLFYYFYTYVCVLLYILT
jgi:hypothetical protein